MKKKGMLIATIVMVLVLAVSLTTATYAWFTSDAQAEVDGVTITTQAATGVQIAVYQGSNYYNGDMRYNNATWESDAEGFGSLLDFSEVSIGKMVNAVTTGDKIQGSYAYTRLETQPDENTDVTTDMYYVDAKGFITAGTNSMTTEAFEALTGGAWYSREAVANSANTFYRPTGYDENTQPYGYYLALANDSDNFASPTYTTYYDIPLAMQSAKETQAILCSIKINPGEGTLGNRWPGMAAATRVRISTEGGQTLTFEPYGGVKYSGTMTDQSTVSGDYYGKDTTGVLNFVVAYNNGAAISSADIYKIKVEIWVEGTDAECVTNLMGDTDFNVEFAFDVYDDALTSEDITTNKYVTKGEVNYYINDVSTGKTGA